MVLYLAMKGIGNWKRSTVLSKSEKNNLPDYVERSYCIIISDLENHSMMFFPTLILFMDVHFIPVDISYFYQYGCL